MTWNKEEVNEMQTQKIRKNHMDILWHEYTDKGGEEIPVTQASLTEKASIVGRVGIMLLSCGTGAWRVRSSMNCSGRRDGDYLYSRYRPDVRLSIPVLMVTMDSRSLCV